MAVVSAGLGYLGAKKQASAAKSAAETQTEFAREAMELAGVEADAGFRQTRRAVNTGFRSENRIARQGANEASGIIDTAEAASIAPLQGYADAGASANAAQLYELGIGEKPDNYAGFEGSTGFNFAKDQGIDAIDSSAASRGGLHSGATMKALAGYTTGLAQQDYGNHYSRLTGLAANGQDAASRISSLRATAGGARLANSGGLHSALAGNQRAKTIGNTNAIANRSNIKIGQGTRSLEQMGNAQAQAQLAGGQAWANGLNSAAQGVNNTLRLAGQFF